MLVPRKFKHTVVINSITINGNKNDITIRIIGNYRKAQIIKEVREFCKENKIQLNNDITIVTTAETFYINEEVAYNNRIK